MQHEYAFNPNSKRWDTFQHKGFGPFVVQRVDLVGFIVDRATPLCSIHINGCKGSGKTTLLHQVGAKILSKANLDGKEVEVYFFESASDFNRESVISFIRELATSGRKAYILVDETQNNVTASVFTLLLKNSEGHGITTIGAGVPEFQTVSGKFRKKIGMDQLFIKSHEVLEQEGIIKYFSKGATEAEYVQIDILLEYLRSYVELVDIFFH